MTHMVAWGLPGEIQDPGLQRDPLVNVRFFPIIHCYGNIWLAWCTPDSFGHRHQAASFQSLLISSRSDQRAWWWLLNEHEHEVNGKMNKKYESANISDVEEHISLKYDIKKRLGKGVSNFFSFFSLVELNLFAQAVQLLTKLPVSVWANRKKTVSLQSSFSFAVSNSSAFMCSNSVSSALQLLNSWNSPDLQFSVDTSVLSKRFIYFGSRKTNSFFADQLMCEDTCSL